MARKTMPPRQTIRAHRKAAGLTQQQLADRLGVSNIAVSLWERAEGEPSAANLAKLSAIFAVPMEAVAWTRAEAAAERASRNSSGERGANA